MLFILHKNSKLCQNVEAFSRYELFSFSGGVLVRFWCGSDLQRGDGLVLMHQVRHDGVQRPLPLAGGAGTGAGVRPELAQLLVLRLVGVRQRDLAARRRVLAGEQDGVGHLLHGQVPDGAQRAPAGGTAGELGPAVGTHLEKIRDGVFSPRSEEQMDPSRSELRLK